jgi:hypothetical protein
MAKNGVETVCSKCGAEIRKGSVYCYGCGLPVKEVAAADAAEIKAAPPADEKIPDPMTDLEIAHSSAAVQTPARSRPARRKVAKIEPKVVEVVWQEPEALSWRFIISAIVFVIVGIGLVVLGLYLR